MIRLYEWYFNVFKDGVSVFGYSSLTGDCDSFFVEGLSRVEGHTLYILDEHFMEEEIDLYDIDMEEHLRQGSHTLEDWKVIQSPQEEGLKKIKEEFESVTKSKLLKELEDGDLYFELVGYFFRFAYYKKDGKILDVKIEGHGSERDDFLLGDTLLFRCSLYKKLYTTKLFDISRVVIKNIGIFEPDIWENNDEIVVIKPNEVGILHKND